MSFFVGWYFLLMKKLSSQDKLRKFTIKMGWVTFIVGIVQGLTALAIFKGIFELKELVNENTRYWCKRLSGARDS